MATHTALKEKWIYCRDFTGAAVRKRSGKTDLIEVVHLFLVVIIPVIVFLPVDPPKFPSSFTSQPQNISR